VERPLGVADGLAQALEGAGVGVVAVDVPQQVGQPAERLLVDLALAEVVLNALAGPLAQPGQVPARAGDPDDRHLQAVPLDQPEQGREDLLVGEVAGGAEEDEGVGTLAVDRAAPWVGTCSSGTMIV
jgi:hypothetical protein